MIMDTGIIRLAVMLVELVLVFALAAITLAGMGYAFVLWLRHKDREDKSLEMVCLQVAVPRDNEIKTDAMEQIFSSIHSIKKGKLGLFGLLTFMQVQPHVSFEIVAMKEDVRFYIEVPEKLRDLVEKQIHGGYPGAEIKMVDEPTIFSEKGHVEYAWSVLRNASYNPIQVYKNLATDPIAGLTSAMAKMGDGEGAHIQMIISPADNKWKGKGRSWIARMKKNEANPEKATYKVDPKMMEAVDNKVSKNGFYTTIRMVVSSTDKTEAKMHMSNLKASFEQYNGDLNGFKGKKIWMKGQFMVDFVYRYPPVNWWGNWTVLNFRTRQLKHRIYFG
jgi:hypothetical protein